MAKIKEHKAFRRKARVKRRGVHAKTKSSNNKSSKNYMKPSRGQG